MGARLASFKLVVGRAGAGTTIPFDDVDLQQISNTFFADSNRAIDLELEYASEIASPNAAKVHAYQLHRAAARLTGNPVNVDRVDRVALIYSNAYAPRAGVIGVMFDRGFATADDPNDAPRYTSVPREGCAVFLDTIAGARDPDVERSRQAYYTTIHELGHIFNLVHRHGYSFMAQSGGGRKAPSDGYWKFVKSEKDWLEAAETDPWVWPGGGEFRDSSGRLSSGDQTGNNANPLSLAISISRSSFAFNEPVELAIEIGLAKETAPGTFEISDEVDPGYDRFNIWIIDPDGEKRRYRPINHYCPSRSVIELTKRRPFTRDISIFGQSGGFTFTKHGVHFIQAVLDLGDEGDLVSNNLEIEIVPPGKRASLDKDLLASSRVQSFLFYRDCDQMKDALNISSQIEFVGDPPLRASLEYTLARYLNACAPVEGVRDDLRKLSVKHAQRAADEPRFLGRQQMRHLSRILSQ